MADDQLSDPSDGVVCDTRCKLPLRNHLRSHTLGSSNSTRRCRSVRGPVGCNRVAARFRLAAQGNSRGGVLTDNFVAEPAAIAAYSAVEAAIAAEIATAGGVNVGAMAAVLTPVFGVIGTEHLIATVLAMTSNLFETGQLAAVHAGQSAVAASASSAFAATEATSAGAFTTITRSV